MSDHSHTCNESGNVDNQIRETSKVYSYGSFDKMSESEAAHDTMTCEKIVKATKTSWAGSLLESDQATTDSIYGAHDPLSAPTREESFQFIQEKALSFISAATDSTNTTIETSTTTKDPEPSELVILSGAIANLCSATLGAGVLSLPYAFYQAGIIVGTILLLVAGLTTVYSIDLMVAACHIYNVYSYEGLTETTLGKQMKFWLELSILIFSGGVAVAYIIAVGDILEKSHLLIQRSRALTITLVWCIAMVPLSMLRKMQSLQFASAFGIASIGTLVFAAAVHLFQDQEGEFETDNEVELVEASISSILFSCLWPSNGLVSVLTACPIIVFAFSCQCNVAAIFEELPEKIKNSTHTNRTPMTPVDRGILTPTGAENKASPTGQGYLAAINESGRSSDTLPISNRVDNRQYTTNSFENSAQIITKDSLMHKVTVCAVSICAILYAMISFVALSDFGKAMTPNMLSSYRAVGVMQVAMSAMAVAVVVAFPLNIFPARVTITGWMLGTKFDNHFFGMKNEEEQESYEKENVQKNNSEAAALLCRITNERNVDTNNFELVEDPMTEALLEPRQQLLAATAGNTEKDENDNEMNFSWKRHLFLTLSLTTSSLAFALVLPNISVVFGLLGGTAASFLGFVVPGCIGLQLCQDLYGNHTSSDNVALQRSGSCVNSSTIDICSSKRRLWCISWLLLIGGTCVGILTTIVTLVNIFVPV